MAKFCIPSAQAQAFKKGLKDSKIDIGKMINMKTSDRTNLLREFFGDSARDVNRLFESKLVLKNRMLGLKNWASKVGEIGRYDPKKKAEIDQAMKEFKEQQRERLFSPKETEAFLSDLVETKLGTKITREEAKNVFEMTTEVERLRENYNPETETWSSQEIAREHGVKKRVTENYLDALHDKDLSIKDSVVGRYSEFRQVAKENKAKAVMNVFTDSVKTISDNLIALKASWDNSFLGRQGRATLINHPTIWFKMAVKSFSDFAKVIGGKNAKDALLAEIYSRPNYMNGEYDKAKLIPKFEEQYPSTLPEKILGLGRVFKASEEAFTGSAIRARTDLYDLMKGIAKNQGVKINDTWIKAESKHIGSLTARGTWGKKGESELVRMVLWAPKMLKANWDVLTMHTFGAGLDTAFARRQAAWDMVRTIGATSFVLAMSKAIDKDSVELDTQSSDFGKIKVGETRFDMTGGSASIVVLASRLVPILWGKGGVKSTTTGITTPLNLKDFGSKTGVDVFVDFLTNKTSPFASIVVDLLRGEMFGGEKPTFANELRAGTIPISIQNILDLKDDASVAAVAGVILDFVGVNAQTYEPYKTEAEELNEELKTLSPEEANARVEALSDTEYSALKKARKDEALGITPEDKAIRNMGVTNEERAIYIFNELADLETPEEKNEYINDLTTKDIITDDVYDQLQMFRKNEQAPQYNKNEQIAELKYKAKKVESEKSMIDIAKLYVEATFTDPLTAVKTLFTKEQLRKIEGGTVIMERIVQGIDPDSRVDHIVPLSLGGDNSDDNLKRVSVETHAANTPVETYLWNLLKEDKISERKARNLILDFKNGEKSFIDVKLATK
jgi:hypothetical protein